MRIVIYCGPCFERWDPEIIARQGLFGSEIMVAEVAKRLARRGHEVSVYAECSPSFFDGVEYLPYSAFTMGEPRDVLVSARRAEVLTVAAKERTKRLLFWAHDSHYDTFGNAALTVTDQFVVVSEWHRVHFAGRHPEVPGGKLLVVHNGVDVERIRAAKPAKFAEGEMPLVWTSSPDRGISALLRELPTLRTSVPGIKLHVFNSLQNAYDFASSRGDQERLMRLRALEAQLHAAAAAGHAELHGRVPQDQLYSALQGANAWVYPTHVAETFCLAAAEATAAGCQIVTSRLGASTASRGR